MENLFKKKLLSNEEYINKHLGDKTLVWTNDQDPTKTTEYTLINGILTRKDFNGNNNYYNESFSLGDSWYKVHIASLYGMVNNHVWGTKGAGTITIR